MSTYFVSHNYSICITSLCISHNHSIYPPFYISRISQPTFVWMRLYVCMQVDIPCKTLISNFFKSYTGGNIFELSVCLSVCHYSICIYVIQPQGVYTAVFPSLYPSSCISASYSSPFRCVAVIHLKTFAHLQTDWHAAWWGTDRSHTLFYTHARCLINEVLPVAVSMATYVCPSVSIPPSLMLLQVNGNICSHVVSGKLIEMLGTLF